MEFLSVCTSDKGVERFDLQGSNLRIGRASGNELILADLKVSRLHAEIERRSDGFYVRDAGGKNGTFLNEERIDRPVLLKAGDQIRVGTTTIIFNALPTPAVEFSDRPLPGGGATMMMPARDLLSRPLTDLPSTPAAGPPRDRVQTPATDGPRRSSGSTAFAAPGSTPASGLLGIIFEADEELVFHRPLDEILERIMDLVHRAVAFERGLLMLRIGERLVPSVVRVPAAESGRTISISRTIADRVIQHRESILTSDALADERFRAGESIAAQQIRSAMCVPLWNNREVIGFLYVDSRHQAGLFTEGELRLLTHLANIAAVKIENARLFAQTLEADRMEQELQKASEIQTRLLPSCAPAIPGYRLHGCSIPCREVGGDCFDYVELPGGRIGIVLADVAGKGLPAALLMCGFQGSMHVLCDLDLPPGETLQRLNRTLLPRIPANRFVTSFYGVLDPQGHSLGYVSAGHCPPLLIRGDGSVEHLGLGGPPLGLFESASYQAARVELGPGDLVLCYSDGVTEGVDAADEEFGEERLAALARDAQAESPESICQRITDAVRRHQGDEVRQDDVTIFILKRID